MASYKGLPNDTVDFDMYLIQFPGGQMTMSLTTKDCAPLSESIHTTEGVFNMGFMGLTEGITDPSVFEMPQACKDLQPSRKKRVSIIQTPIWIVLYSKKWYCCKKVIL